MGFITRDLLNVCTTWSRPRAAVHAGRQVPLLLACSYCPPSPDIASSARSLPEDLRLLWSIADSVRLFEDRTYGQWGLELLSYSASGEMTARFVLDRGHNSTNGDRVIGRFLGDSDLLLLRCDENADDYGSVIVALPVDPRSEWYFVSTGLDEFLRRYTEEMGAKFWE